MVDTNILGLLAATQAAIPYLAESGTGQVINISSMSGRRVTSRGSAHPFYPTRRTSD
jgi:NADP-dependent 3-hydroxy acid dehydrogenase YdfG